MQHGDSGSGSHGNGSADAATIMAAATALSDFLAAEEDGQATTLFSMTESAVVGVYAGSQIDKASAASIMREIAKRAESLSADRIAAQLCHAGFLIDTKGGLGAARDIVRGWRDAECVPEPWGPKDVWTDAPLATIPGSEVKIGPNLGEGSTEETLDKRVDDGLDKRATCSYTQVQSGDGCWALADRCKITQDQLIQYNGGSSKLCDTIQPGQYLCCSSGTLPDFSPQPNPDGTCKTVTFSGKFCGDIAQENHMTVDQIEQRNKKTWGWAGCNAIQPGQVFCLSTGSPPMPAPVANYVCGPQVNGTKKPSNMDDLAKLNPCPLNACCDVWGNCGTTEEFCTIALGDTGAPGTTQPGANSCISNCGTDIVNNGSPPSQFIKVGYFESFNPSRPCLHMRPGQINTNTYTHVHYAFANITTDFKVDVSGDQKMFNEFKGLSGTKKADTFPIFRESVTAAQRDTFAHNVVDFLTSNNLDGLDFDWEYPGAPDIPGT
jgi:chitinase